MEDNRRFLINFDTKTAEKKHADALVIGCGISALYAALRLAETKKVILMTSYERLRETFEGEPDPNVVDFASKIIKKFDPKEAIYEGRGLTSDVAVAKFLENADENQEILNKYAKLENIDIPEDQKTSENQDTILYYHKTDDFIESRLSDAVRANQNIEVIYPYFVCDLLTKIVNNETVCYGVFAKDFKTDNTLVVTADVFVLAQNGFKGMYDDHYHDSYGDDVAMFLRAGGETTDMEFIHFWPMVLNSGDGKKLVIVPNTTLRDGGILRNISGERFMQNYSDLGEFASSSNICRAIERENKKLSTENVYIDITFKDTAYLKQKHKSLYDLCRERGIDITKEFIPVRTKAGYCLGGIKTDEYGRTSIKNVYCCSSDGCNGFFGTRLSRHHIIPHKVVFAGVTVNEILNEGKNITKASFEDIESLALKNPPRAPLDIEHLTKMLRANNVKNLGPVRDSDGLYESLRFVRMLKGSMEDCQIITNESAILKNIILISEIVTMSAIERHESRGAHYRDDYPETNNSRWRKHIIRKMY